MSFLQAFVICFVTYFIYKLLTSGGVSKAMIDEMKVVIAKGFKNVSQEYKDTLAASYNDLHSGDTARIDAAIKRLDDKFNQEIADAEKMIAEHEKKPVTAPSNTSTQKP